MGFFTMMLFYTYILYSDKLGKFYIGSTQDLDKRIDEYNKGYVKFTSMGIPWRFIWKQEHESRSLAVQLENKIKKRGAKRFLSDLNFPTPGK